MSLLYRRNAAGIVLQNGGRTVFDTGLLPAAGVPSAKIVTTQTVTFPQPVMDNAYYWWGKKVSTQASEAVAGYMTMVAGEWGPKAVDPPSTNDLPDVPLGTVPPGTDFLNIAATIIRTKNPQNFFGEARSTIPPQGKQIRLIGGSCLLEEGYPLSRSIAIVLGHANEGDPIPVYLRRYQSISSAESNAISWSPSNNPSQSGAYTWGGQRGVPVVLTGYTPEVPSPSIDYTKQRGSAWQIANIPLNVATDFSSIYSVQLEITPGYFNINATILPPAKKMAMRLGNASNTVGTAVGSMSFAGIQFGQPEPTRRIVVTVTASGGGGVASCSIGGVAATRVASVVSSIQQSTAIFVANVPAGNNGTITVNFVNASRDAYIAAWALYHLSSGFYSATGSVTPGSAVALLTAANGFAFAACLHTGFGGTMTGLDLLGWDSLFSQYSYIHEVGYATTTGASRSLSYTSISTGTEGVLAAASFY